MSERQQLRRPLRRVEEAAIGAACGSLEVFIMQPTVYWKNELQQGRFDFRRAITPRYAYRGTLVSAASIAPITAIQFSVNGSCTHAFSSSLPPITTALLSGMAAGAVSAFVQSPCQLLEINQQKHGGSVFSIARRVVSTHGLLSMWRGWSLTAVREGLFCCCYLSTAPLLSHAARTRSSLGDTSSSVAAAVAAGSLGAVLTHPADTLKTRLQGNILPVAGQSGGWTPVNVSLRATLADMAASGGGRLGAIAQCYWGFSPRLFRLVFCTFIYSRLNEVFTTFLAEGEPLQYDKYKRRCEQGTS